MLQLTVSDLEGKSLEKTKCVWNGKQTERVKAYFIQPNVDYKIRIGDMKTLGKEEVAFHLCKNYYGIPCPIHNYRIADTPHLVMTTPNHPLQSKPLGNAIAFSDLKGEDITFRIKATQTEVPCTFCNTFWLNGMLFEYCGCDEDDNACEELARYGVLTPFVLQAKHDWK